MRLVNSKTEQDFREVLIKSHNLLFNDDIYQPLLKVLQTKFPKMKTAYFIRHTQDQSEDFYTLLIDLDVIVSIELSRYSHDDKPIMEVNGINDFVKGLSKIEQIKLMVALDLAKKDLML